jgi:glycosyltransferase involved in cell wall biosynthesis
MYRGARIAVVMPAYNVRRHLRQAVVTVPAVVDDLVVVDDGSDDGTSRVLRDVRRPGLLLIRHPRNRGVGAAIATGYAAAAERGAEVIAVMAGDGQMDPADLPALLDPVVSGAADYAKGDRFRHAEVWRAMPPQRIAGNVLLSLLTKLSSCYLGVFDSQCGYTAISRETLRAIDGRVFAGYGYLNDLLARLHTAGARVVDVPVRPIYDGQPSGIRLRTVAHPILTVLVGSLARRLWQQRAAGRPRRSTGPHRERGDAHRPAHQLLSAS